MPLKVVLDSLDGIDESIQPLYVEKDGKFILDLDGVDNHPSVTALRNGHTNSKRERDQARQELNTLKQKLAGYPEDFDPDEYQRLRTEDEARRNDPNNRDVRSQIEAATNAVKQQYEGKLANQKRQLDGEVKTRDDKIAGLTGTIRKVLIDEALTKSLAENGVDAKLMKGAKALIASQIEVVEDNGEFVARMKSDFGGDEVGKYVASWVQTDEGKAYVTPASGGDAKGNNRTRQGTGEVNPYAKGSWNKTQQGLLLNKDRGKAERLAKAAGFADLDSANRALSPIEK
jgi:hypothetical protein